MRSDGRLDLPIYMRQFIKEVFSLVTDQDKIHIRQRDELLALLRAILLKMNSECLIRNATLMSGNASV
jgi:hypothetical protein